MKPLLLKVAESPADSIDIRHEQRPYFDNPWHYHPELELTLVIKSRGIRFVGDAIEPFAEGDLVLVGSNLPHYWRNDERYYASDSAQSAEAIILRFRANAWGNDFLATRRCGRLPPCSNGRTGGFISDWPWRKKSGRYCGCYWRPRALVV